MSVLLLLQSPGKDRGEGTKKAVNRRVVEKAITCLATAPPTAEISKGLHTPFLVLLKCVVGAEPRLLRCST